MTRHKSKKVSSVEEALEILYGSGIRDLTAEGYEEAMRKLRQDDPGKARRVERMLSNVLSTRAFPRRGRPWYETSEGTRARLALLPGNPHVELDVSSIREVLGIPEGQIHATEDDPPWKDVSSLVRPQAIRRVVEGNMVGEWLHLHRQAARGQLPKVKQAGYTLLSASLRKSAVKSARVSLQVIKGPDWLRFPPDKMELPHQPMAPIDLAASMLAVRHRLPLRITTSLTFYILTLDPSWITGLQPVDVEVAYGESDSDPAAFTITVKGIDEFITKDDWDLIWSRYVKPRQDSSWQQRGMRPQGRRTVDIERLKKVLPLYRRIVLEDLEEKDILREVPEDWDEHDLNLDQETIRRAIHALKALLPPSSGLVH
jgi:hypothetical protein